MNKRILLALLWSISSFIAIGQSMTGNEIKAAANTQLDEGIEELMSFMKIPNIGSNQEDVTNNLNWCIDRFKNLEFNTRIITTEGAPLLFAEKLLSKNKKTILFYLQIDGQPVDASAWDQPDPFTPVIKQQTTTGNWVPIDWKSNVQTDPDWRIFGRSASDSKGPALSFITALDIFKQRSLQAGFNIKVIMDFQEELGSPTLAAGGRTTSGSSRCRYGPDHGRNPTYFQLANTYLWSPWNRYGHD